MYVGRWSGTPTQPQAPDGPPQVPPQMGSSASPGRTPLAGSPAPPKLGSCFPPKSGHLELWEGLKEQGGGRVIGCREHIGMWEMTGRRFGGVDGVPVHDGVLGDDDVGCRMLMQDQGSGAAAAGLQCWCQILVPDWDAEADGSGLGCWYRALVQNLECCCIPLCPDPPSLGIRGVGVTAIKPLSAHSCLAATPTHNHRRACLKMKVFVCCASSKYPCAHPGGCGQAGAARLAGGSPIPPGKGGWGGCSAGHPGSVTPAPSLPPQRRTPGRSWRPPCRSSPCGPR